MTANLSCDVDKLKTAYRTVYRLIEKNYNPEVYEHFSSRFNELLSCFDFESISYCLTQYIYSELDYEIPGNRGLGRFSEIFPRLAAYFRKQIINLSDDEYLDLFNLIQDVVLRGYLVRVLFAQNEIHENISNKIDLFKLWIPEIYSSEMDDTIADALWTYADSNILKKWLTKHRMVGGGFFSKDKTDGIITYYALAGYYLRSAELYHNNDKSTRPMFNGHKELKDDYIKFTASLQSIAYASANAIMTLEKNEISIDKLIKIKTLLFFEFLYLFLYLTDWFAFERFDEQTRSNIMIEIEKLTIYAAIDKAYKKSSQKIVQGIFDRYRESVKIYSQYKQLVNKKQESPKGTLFLEFGKRIAVLSEHDSHNITYIMAVKNIVQEYIMTEEISNFVDKLPESNG